MSPSRDAGFALTAFFYVFLFSLACADPVPDEVPAAASSSPGSVAAQPPSSRPFITDEAQKLYEKYQSAVYQIRVIDLASGKKSVIGSGFQFTNDGAIATNFHVISDAVHEPKRFKVELLRYDGVVGTVDIKAIDVVHDLAILQTRDRYDSFLELGSSEFPKGTRIFSMGNPHDLGMSIVEGTYNGLLEKTLYRKIHFSGSLNGGMSGGPAMDYEGRVIGVNVSTYGNQLSFLVPVEYLKELYARVKYPAPFDNWSNAIERQLLANQLDLIDTLLKTSWEKQTMGDARVPGEMTELFKCWGDSKDNSEELYTWTSLRCSSQDDIFVSSDLRTGQVIYNYLWIKSKGLNTFRFYNLYEHWFSQPFDFDNAKKDDVKNFQCEAGFVRISGENWKVMLCARQYKSFPQLYDINLNIASAEHYRKGLLADLVALGVTKDKALQLTRKFMGAIEWKK